MKRYHFPIVVETDEDGIYIVSCPTFNGCHADGKTIDEAIENIKEVIRMCAEEDPKATNKKFVELREIEMNYSGFKEFF